MKTLMAAFLRWITRRRFVVIEPTVGEIEKVNRELRELAALASSGQGMG